MTSPIESHIHLPSKPRVISEEGFSGVYEIEGLHPGYGYTLGNSLRRIILSSLVGTAITSVKIEGAEHEFATLPGIKEDMIMVILNLKKVRFNFAGDEPKKISLNIKGAKVVTASDIETGGLVEVLNKDQYLATLTEKNAILNIEITLEKGLGYLPKEVVRRDRNEIGLIFVDATFTPITRVSYEVENMRVGDRTDYNRLRVYLNTDGTLAPKEALEKSIIIMIEQLKAIVGFKEETGEIIVENEEKGSSRGIEAETDKTDGEALKTRVEDLNFSPRVAKALTAKGIRTAGGLARKKEADLREIDGLGEKGIEEIKKALANLGIALKS